MPGVTVVGAGVAGLTIGLSARAAGLRRHRPRSAPRGRRPRPHLALRRLPLRRRPAPVPHREPARRRFHLRRPGRGGDRDPAQERRPHVRPVPRVAAAAEHPAGDAVLADGRARPSICVRKERLRRRVVRGRHRQQVRPHALRDLLQALHREVPVLLAGGAASRLGARRRQPRGDRQARAGGRPVVAAEEHADAEAGRDDVPLPPTRRRASSRTGWPKASAGGGGRVLLGPARRRHRGSAAAGSSRSAPAASAFPVDNVVWTAPITLATSCSASRASTSSTCRRIFYNFEIDAPAKLDFQWTYYGGDEIFSRVSAPTAFAPSMAPPGKSGLCVEVTCREGDERWQAPERLTEAVIADLVRTGRSTRRPQVERVHIERVPFTYPIYKLELPAAS